MPVLHKSVLPRETIELLDVHSNHDYIDCTLGGGDMLPPCWIRMLPAAEYLRWT